jgi:CRISPR-associated RAMP protein (TIGR02581 family)
MLKKNLNYAVAELTISPLDPLLIKSGQSTVSGVDMAFVQTYRRGDKPEPFIPGSSLKGVVRSYAEKICRSLRDNPVPVCLPYLERGNENENERNQASCGSRIKNHLRVLDRKELPSSHIYRISCPICRMFGSHYFIGRTRTSDAYIVNGYKLEDRDGVAIDRFSGGAASRAKYDLQVLVSGDFHTRIEIQNFELWQLGLLGLVLRDMEEGLIRIGMGTSRGLGRIKSTVRNFEVGYWGKKPDKLIGIESICSDDERKMYGFFKEKNDPCQLNAHLQKGLRYEYNITENWKDCLEGAVRDFNDYIMCVPWPEIIDSYNGGE